MNEGRGRAAGWDLGMGEPPPMNSSMGSTWMYAPG